MRVAATIVIGTIAQKATRQRPRPASAPPRAGPPSAAVPQAAEMAASMYGHSPSGNMSRTIACAAAMSMPPPRP